MRTLIPTKSVPRYGGSFASYPSGSSRQADLFHYCWQGNWHRDRTCLTRLLGLTLLLCFGAFILSLLKLPLPRKVIPNKNKIKTRAERHQKVKSTTKNKKKKNQMQADGQQAKSNASAAYLFSYPLGPACQHNENNPKHNPQSHDYKGDPSHNTGFQQDVPEFAGRCFINQNTLEQREMKRKLKKNPTLYLFLCFL